MLLYYITDRKQFQGTEREQRTSLLRRISEAASSGVDYIQLREKDLSISELERLARDAVRLVRENSPHTRLLINSRTDVGLAVGADGVHLTSQDIQASEARSIRAASALHHPSFLVAVSCHSVAEVRAAGSHGADFVVLGPIFEKTGTNAVPLGVEAIRVATHGQKPDFRVEAGDNRVGVPVLALGGLNLSNVRSCLEHGAAGVAGIRLFQDGNIRNTVEILKRIPR